MRVLVLHSDVAPGAPPDELDTLISAEAVSAALEKLGHEAPRAAFTPDMTFLKGLLDRHKPDVVFNIAVMAGSDGPYVFPLAEMCFNTDWPKGKPKLVSFAAKWEEDTFDYNGSQRRFGCEVDEPALGRALIETTKKVWALFSLRG